MALKVIGVLKGRAEQEHEVVNVRGHSFMIRNLSRSLDLYVKDYDDKEACTADNGFTVAAKSRDEKIYAANSISIICEPVEKKVSNSTALDYAPYEIILVSEIRR